MCKIASEYHKELQSPPKRENNDMQKIDNFLQIVTQSIDNNNTQI